MPLCKQERKLACNKKAGLLCWVLWLILFINLQNCTRQTTFWGFRSVCVSVCLYLSKIVDLFLLVAFWGRSVSSRGHVCCCERVRVATGACSAAAVWQEAEKGQGVCWRSCVPVYGYCVSAGHTAANDRCPVCHRRLALADGERGELPLHFTQWVTWKPFIVLYFLCILYFPLFFMSSLSTVLPFILLPDADTHT